MGLPVTERGKKGRRSNVSDNDGDKSEEHAASRGFPVEGHLTIPDP